MRQIIKSSPASIGRLMNMPVKIQNIFSINAKQMGAVGSL
jgi:hypothetical protein